MLWSRLQLFKLRLTFNTHHHVCHIYAFEGSSHDISIMRKIRVQISILLWFTVLFSNLFIQSEHNSIYFIKVWNIRAVFMLNNSVMQKMTLKRVRLGMVLARIKCFYVPVKFFTCFRYSFSLCLSVQLLNIKKTSLTTRPCSCVPWGRNSAKALLLCLFLDGRKLARANISNVATAKDWLLKAPLKTNLTISTFSMLKKSGFH